MFALPALSSQPTAQDLDYLLRRAQEEAIAEIRATNVDVAGRHGAMARAYASQALEILNADASQRQAH